MLLNKISNKTGLKVEVFDLAWIYYSITYQTNLKLILVYAVLGIEID
jgi:hypothetical protein